MSAFKENLMIALHDAVRNFNESGDPNSSVVKSAVAHDFNIDQATRLLETFNTARTIYHYKTAADKTAQFQLADAAVVIPELYKTGKADEKKSNSFSLSDYSDYNIHEADYSTGMMIDKAAGVQEMDQGEPVDVADTSMEAQAAQAYRIINVTRDIAKTAQDEAAAHATAASVGLSKLSAMLRVGYEDQVVARYATIINGYSDHNRLGPVVTKLAEHMPEWIKKAVVLTDTVVDDRSMEPIIMILEKAAECMEIEAEMLAVAKQMGKEADTFETEWLSIVLPTFPLEKAASVVDLITTDRMQKSAQTTTTSNKETTDLFGMPKTITTKKETKPILGDSIGAGIGKGIESNVADLVGGIGTAFSGPREEANKKLSERLKNTQRQIMLEELMTTDPVLSNESPENVSKAYSAVLALAPDVASNKEVVRAILRQAVHSVAISPYEADTWTSLEKNIRQLTGKMPQVKPEQGGKGGKH